MTIQVRITRESGPPTKRVAVVVVDKKTKKSTLYTRLENQGDSCVLVVYDNQDVTLRETD